MELRVAVSREPHNGSVDHFYEILGSSLPMEHPLLRELEASLGAPEALAAIEAISGKPVARVEMRSYVYLAGHFLLPHSDFRPDLDRRVAYAFYLVPRETSTGGELELFECEMEELEVTATREAGRIEPLANRLVLFDVSPSSLHQVREVTSGGRVSLSGWFSGAPGRPEPEPGSR
jgi:Rps23 Pro-64 3,4-dihydroxylase Tpa1-like proline 4-hydroxylase